MCGIFLYLIQQSERSAETDTLIPELETAIANRGPSFNSKVSVVLEHGTLTIGASVLHIQGETYAPQPHVDSHGNILAWNGEVFGGLEISPGTSDTLVVALLLHQTLADPRGDLPAALSVIKGPYAFVYYHASSSTLYFGRDPFGRRSLLVRTSSISGTQTSASTSSSPSSTASSCLTLCSVVPESGSSVKVEPLLCRHDDGPVESDVGEEGGWSEVEIKGVYAVSLRSDADVLPRLLSWPSARLKLGRRGLLDRFIEISSLAPSLAPSPSLVPSPSLAPSFSPSPSSSSVPRSQDLNATAGLREIALKLSQRQGFDATSKEFCRRLVAAVRRRVSCVRPRGTETTDVATATATATVPAADSSCGVGVLFSGGIDSVLLAAVLHLALKQLEDGDEGRDVEGGVVDKATVHVSTAAAGGGGAAAAGAAAAVASSSQPVLSPLSIAALPPRQGSRAAIELINVSFDSEDGNREAPDRMASIVAVAELQALFPDRVWRLVHVDVTPEERATTEARVKRLIRPSNTHMDLNIGTAFWFAARGNGYIRSYSTQEVEAALSAEDAGRPMVREGATGAAKSVGLKEWKTPGTTSNTTSNTTSTQMWALQQSFGEGGGGGGGEGRGAQKLKCSNPKCGRVPKDTCMWVACKRCCLKGWDGRGGSGGCAVHKHKKGFGDNVLDDKESAREGEEKEAEVGQVIAAGDEEEVSSETVTERVNRGHIGGREEGGEGGGGDVLGVERDLQAEASISTRIPYQCDCIALLVGIGADEQMAGYSRHRTVYLRGKRGEGARAVGGEPTEGVRGRKGRIVEDVTAATDTASSPSAGQVRGESEVETTEMTEPTGEALQQILGLIALEAELAGDMERLWKRNLGRDDRCVADSGREAWFPFIDEDVVEYLQSLCINDIADLDDAPGVGDKRILRQAAAAIGLKQCSTFVKRAIQFGTRVAKDTNKQYHGSHRKGKGTHTI